MYSMIESGQFNPPPDRQPDVIAMIPGDQYVVVADLRTDLGAELMDARVDLPRVVDVGLSIDVKTRVQRANAVDVFAVGKWRTDWK